MVGKTDDCARRQYLVGGTFHCKAGFLNDNAKDLRTRTILGLLGAPSGKLLGDRIEEGDAPPDICDNYRIPDARERHGQDFLLPAGFQIRNEMMHHFVANPIISPRQKSQIQENSREKYPTAKLDRGIGPLAGCRATVFLTRHDFGNDCPN